MGHGEPEGAPALILEILIREKRFKSRLESLNELHRAFAVKKKKEEREREKEKNMIHGWKKELVDLVPRILKVYDF